MQTRIIKPHSLLKKFFIVIALVLLLMSLGVGYGAYWVNSAFAAVNINGSEKNFTIGPNESVASIAKRLKAEGLIRDETVFRLYTRFSCVGTSLANPLTFLNRPQVSECVGGKIQAGVFKLTPADNMQTLANKLTAGKPLETWVKVVEGLRNEEVAKIFAEKLEINEEEFLKEADLGYLFPDTYLFSTEGVTASTIVTKMRSTFDEKFGEDLRAKLSDQDLTLEQAVTLASLVERESFDTEERPIIAGILLKRLREGWRLEVDATVQFALGYDEVGKTWWKKSLTGDDLAINSPYNTRKLGGLPPGPICNPGLSALKAVAEPVESDYYFYLHDSEGKIHFGRTLDEHNANKARYL